MQHFRLPFQVNAVKKKESGIKSQIRQEGFCMKMIMAILHKDDELETIEELNIAGYMVTKLATTGGFLKKKSTTIMVVVDDEKVAEALKIIKKNSGERKTITYANPALISGQSSMSAAPSVPINVQVGGSTIFVLNVEQMEKY